MPFCLGRFLRLYIGIIPTGGGGALRSARDGAIFVLLQFFFSHIFCAGVGLDGVGFVFSCPLHLPCARIGVEGRKPSLRVLFFIL